MASQKTAKGGPKNLPSFAVAHPPRPALASYDRRRKESELTIERFRVELLN
jgi:hypothetical protein